MISVILTENPVLISKLYCLTWTSTWSEVLNHSTRDICSGSLCWALHSTELKSCSSLPTLLANWRWYNYTGEELVSWWGIRSISLRGWSVRTLSQFAQVNCCRKSRLTMKLVRKSLQSQVCRLTRCYRSLICKTWKYYSSIVDIPYALNVGYLNCLRRISSSWLYTLMNSIVSRTSCCRPSPQLVL